MTPRAAVMRRVVERVLVGSDGASERGVRGGVQRGDIQSHIRGL